MATDVVNGGAHGCMRKGVIAVLIATVALSTLATFFGANRYFERVETRAAANQMALYLRALNETLRQHQHLPFVLSRDPEYSDALDPTAVDPSINTRLKEISDQAGLEAVYLMNSAGLVLASSNAGMPNSFLGQNYGFRPYFQEALSGQRSDYFAIGATSGRPGYFVAEPVTYASGTKKGVIAIKLDVSEFQRSWQKETETVLAVNKDGIVVLASKPDWLYRPIAELEPAKKTAILQSRQFGNEPLDVLAWQNRQNARVTVDGTNYIAAVGNADWRDWAVYYLQPEAVVTRQTLVATGLFGSLIAVLVGFATFLRSRRIALAFAASERQREALIDTNQRLENAQIELARSAKMAALGHLAASVTHELGQPISAFRNHLAAAEIGGEITSPKTASNLNKLVERMEAITKQFRYFARGRTDAKERVELGTMLAEVLSLLETELRASGVTINYQAGQKIEIYANKVLLEQAIVNLLKNSIYAVECVANPNIDLDVSHHETKVEIRIADNGPGLGDATLKDLQEPFYSTKPSGVGMGLGLAIATEIIKDHNGELSLGAPEHGAEFIVTLPINQGGDPT